MNASYALRPAWTPLTIALMVLGFIFAWPLGLVMLAYILWGHRVPRSGSTSTACGATGRAASAAARATRSTSQSGNFAFDEYREKELKRLDEERRGSKRIGASSRSTSTISVARATAKSSSAS